MVKPVCFAAAVCVVLSGCQTTQPTGKPGSLDVLPVGHVIEVGLGHRFDATYDDLISGGFKDLTSSSPDKVGELFGVFPGEFFAPQWIWVSPDTKQLYRMHAFRTFAGKKNLPNGCMTDYRLISESLQEKYPTLITPNKSRAVVQEMVESDRCEGRRSIGDLPYFERIGRCISLSCADLPDGTSILTIEYVDNERRSAASAEIKAYKERNKDKILKDRGLDSKKF